MPFELSNATILVPVDFDEPSHRAVENAVAFARAFHARVVVLHVVPPTSFPEGTRLLPGDAADPVDLEEYVSTRARRLLDEYFATSLIAGLPARMEARSGHPVDAILRAIGECDARLVVVGTHGRHGAARLALGSVAESLVRRSPVPVLVVRQPDPPPAARRAADRKHDFATAGATVLSGAVAGAATGALAGPVGAIVGGTIGSAIGLIAGGAMAREEIRATTNDRMLDDQIGVTSGSLGTPPETKRPSPDVLAGVAEP